MEAITLDWPQIMQGLNTASLVAFAYLLARGYLVPMSTVERYMLQPRDERIVALENVSRKKDEQHMELTRMMAAALEAQGHALKLTQELLQQERGKS